MTTTTFKRRNLAMAILAFAMFMDLMDVTIVNVAIPSIRDDLGASPAQIEWLVGGYVLAFAGVLITAGRLGDRYGRQRIFLIGIIGFTLASVLASTAQTGSILVASRVLQGFFAGLMVPQVLANVQVLYRPKERAPVFAILGVITAMAAVIGPVLGGWLVTNNPIGGEWRSIFFINVPIGIIIAVAGYFLVPNTKSEKVTDLDIVGVVLAVGGVLLLVYPLVEGRQLGWPAWSFVMMALSPVALTAFVYQQKRRTAEGSALIPLRLFGNRGFVGGSAIQFLFQGSITSFFLILAIYVQVGLNFEAITAGAMTLPFSVGAVIAAGVAAGLTTKLGRILPLVGAVMMSAGTAWTIQVIRSSDAAFSSWDTVVPMALAGLGLTTMLVPLLDIALSTVDVNDSGAASGTLNTFAQVGGAVGVAVTGVLFFGEAGRYTQPELLHALSVAAWVPITGYALCALASFLLPGLGAVRKHAEEQERIADIEEARLATQAPAAP
ncbi:MFS transporter [Williamsia sp. 1138]|uniref:MFS transporter n=1 Tax=Williamsia sp. 1138 TaxID=1903117 RepID=UPI000A11871D|nr:MFS transporter [Williamsia sp. 1138]OZG30949.1 MFS transporter [Williamsia sp. 1138]